MNQTFEEIIEDEKATRILVLRTKTSAGHLTIKKIGSGIHARIVAIDQDGQRAAETMEISQKGLNWVKAHCRGWGGWKRLNWEIVSL